MYAFFIRPRDFRVENLVRTVEQLYCLTCAHAQHAANVVGGVIRQGDFAACGNQFRMVNAGNAHSQKFHVSCDISEWP